MAKICYYVSDYGYGHASRSIAIIRELLHQGRSCDFRLQLTVICGKALPFLQASLGESEDVDYRSIASDPGYVLKYGTAEADVIILAARYEAYIRQLPQHIAAEAAWLREVQADLVLSDIVPAAFPASRQAGVPSVGLSNFTWYTAYKDMLEQDQLVPLHAAYMCMDQFIALAGSSEPTWGRTLSAGFFCREVDLDRAARLRSNFRAAGFARIVYFVVGMSAQMDELLSGLTILQDSSTLYIISSTMNATGRNVVQIPVDETESQLYMAAADLVITKPGWGTVAEAVVMGKPLLLLERQMFCEDRNTIAALGDSYPYRLVDPEQLRNMQIQELFGLWTGMVDSSEEDFPLRWQNGNKEQSRIASELMNIVY